MCCLVQIPRLGWVSRRTLTWRGILYVPAGCALLCSALLHGAGAGEPDERVGDLGSSRRLRIEGLSTFDPAQVHRAVTRDRAFVASSHPYARLADLCTVVEKLLTAGYLGSGFPDVKVETRIEGDGDERRIVASVSEGPRCVSGDIRVPDTLLDPARSLIVAALTEPAAPAAGSPAGEKTAQEAEPALWRPGAPAPFDERWRTRARARVAEVMAAEAFSGATIDLRLERSESGSANLQLQVFGQTTQREIDSIELLAPERTDAERLREWLERDVGLRKGVVPRSELLDLARVRLERTGCFMDPEVELVPVAGDPTRARVEIRLRDDPRLPAFGRELSENQRFFLAIHDWMMGPLASGAEDLRATIRAGSGALMVQATYNAQEGAVVRIRTVAGEGPATETAISAAREEIMWYGGRQRRALRQPSPAVGCLQVSLDPADPGSHGPPLTFRVGVGATSHRSGASSVAFEARVEPPALMLAASAYDWVREVDGDRVSLRGGDWVRVARDPGSGRSFELALTDPRSEVYLEGGPGLLARDRLALEEAAAGWPLTGTGDRPMCDAIELLLDDVLAHAVALNKIPATAAERGRELWRGMRAALAEPLETYLAERDPVRAERFKLPRGTHADGARSVQWLREGLQVALAAARDYWSPDSWIVLLITAVHGQLDSDPARAKASLRTLLEPGRTGPRGCWVAAWTLRELGLPGNLSFGERGLAMLQFEPFWRDLTAVLKQPEQLALCLEEIHDVHGAALLLPESARPAAMAALMALREAEGPDAKATAVRRLFESCWEPCLEPLLRTALERVRK